MSLRLIAHEAYYRIRALETALIVKGILREGEVQELHDEAVRQETEARQALWHKSWDKLKDGVEVELRPYHDKPQDGTVVAKSIHPFATICICDKKQKIACFTRLSLSDIHIKTEDGTWEYISNEGISD